MAERLSRRWKWIAIVSLLVAAGLLIALIAVFALFIRTVGVTDDRLIGTWQSDVDRTISGFREQKPVDDKHEAALRKLFGKLRVTYTPAAFTTELNGNVETYQYTVLGKDKHSVAIREIKDKASPLDGLVELTEFSVFQFDGPDSYWLYTQIGGIREYFHRVR